MTAIEEPKERGTTALLTIAETCEALRVSRWSVHRLIQSKRLESILLGRRRLVPEAAVQQLIEALRAEERV